MTREIAQAHPHQFANEAAFRKEIMEPCKPVLLKGAARDWPLLQRGGPSIRDQLRQFDAGREAEIFIGRPEISRRYYYDEDFAGFNFERESVTFAEGLDRILASAGQAGADTLYMGSLPSERYLPGVEELTRLPFLPSSLRPRFWIGHASSVACHYDTQDNVACVALGRRRFTLFPPEAIGDLYVGPIDFTMAGQPVGLAVDSEPGDPRFARFEAIRDMAHIAELEAGDAIYIPKLWWHKVEALDPLNVLVNFWWDGFSAGPDQPFAAMMLALITIAERPAAERAAWRAWFDHYVFRPDSHPLSFLPPEKHGILGPLEEGNYQRIRMMVMRMLRGG
ncbi:hypothetical protein FHS61_001062 [Altererythrobacter atlanticus]|uniref:Uncharacterized protein n=1 Tax=Croceibacterium atlanticum TaxID=1267766 RepID=A0A0F7KVQ0_9SPHN|nr:cupin-like domain-containing protein [Croceibacterium atlanticum]AKH43236.1 hypothetical protein WYH_02203 [Croceibacterium atlanticum]MBB5732058.1 hypothetical protein [Croceibacterium atlanticum]